MNFIKIASLIAAVYVISGTAARAQEQCPAGPFETDARVIAAAIAAQPLKPRVWDESPGSHYSPPSLTDGLTWGQEGGFMTDSTHSLRYDAERYIAVSVEGVWPVPGLRLVHRGTGRRLPNQVTRRIGIADYVTTVVRPTTDQARRFACLANRMMAVSEAPTGHENQQCDSTAAYSREGSDEYAEGGALLSHGSIVKYDEGLSCDTRWALFSRAQALARDMIDEAVARADGTWRAPYVRSIATDTADNLYLLLAPGTLKHQAIDIRKITPSGTWASGVTPIFYPDLHAWTVDRRGHPVVTVGFDVYDIEPGVDPGDMLWAGPHVNRVPLRQSLYAANSVDQRWSLDSIAGDASNHYYVTSGSNILQITLAGDLVAFASIPQRTSRRDLHQPTYIAATADGTLFVSDPESNTIFKVTPEKVVTRLAGTPGKSGTTDGPADKALFKSPKGLAVDRNGTLYVADSGNQTIRRISPDGQVVTFVGKPGKRGTLDGRGAAARLDRPTSIAIDSTGTLYVANGEDNLIRKISPDGVASTMNEQQFIDTP